LAPEYSPKCQSLFGAAGDESLGLEPQKKSLIASERDEAARQVWREEMAQVAAHQLVFVDECGSHLALTPLYTYAPRGERAVGSVPKNRGQNTTIMGALTLSGVEAAMTLEGAADGAAFEVFVERILLPVLHPGQLVVMDNLNIHKSQRVRQLIERAGCRVWFLPTYSPDLNPIEKAWSKLKEYLRRIGARMRESLEQAIGQGLDTITAQDAVHWFRHCGCHFI
jgi:transposase